MSLKSSQIQKRRRAILRAVRGMTSQGGIAPTIREVSAATGIPKSSVYRHVCALWDMGLVEMGSGRTPGVRIVAGSDGIM